MRHRTGSLRRPEDQIIVLRSVTGRIEAAGLPEKRRADRQKVADIVGARQIIRIKIRLEIRREEETARHGHLVLVRVDEIRLRIPVDRVHDLPERGRIQHVVVVGKGDPLSLCLPDRGVGILRDASVFLQMDIADPALAGCGGPKEGAQRVRPASVRETELPLSVGLGPYRVNQLLQEGRRRVVKRNDEADQRFISETGGPFRGPLRLRLLAVHCPFVVPGDRKRFSRRQRFPARRPRRAPPDRISDQPHRFPEHAAGRLRLKDQRQLAETVVIDFDMKSGPAVFRKSQRFRHILPLRPADPDGRVAAVRPQHPEPLSREFRVRSPAENMDRVRCGLPAVHREVNARAVGHIGADGGKRIAFPEAGACGAVRADAPRRLGGA